MRAAILVQQRAPLEVEDVDPPALGVGHVLVDVAHAAICGKQLEEVSGRRGADPYLPHLLGHEGAGVVRAVGPGVRKVKPGDHVVLHWMKGTGIDAAPPTFRREGRDLNAGPITTFSEQTVVAENRVTTIHPGFPLDLASLLGCAATTGLGVVCNDLNLRPGQSLAVFGVGGLGLSVVQSAALVSAHPIVAVDIHEGKLERARRLGATHAVNAAVEDVPRALQALAGPGGLDAAVDTTGDNQVRRLAYDATSPTGTTVLAGVPHHEDRMTIDSFPLHFGRRLVGSHGGSTRPEADIPRCVRLQDLGRLRLGELITHRFALEDINDAMDLMRKGEGGRVLLTMAPPGGRRR